MRVVAGPGVARREQTAPQGQKMRDEADRKAERLLELRRVLVGAGFGARPAPETPDLASTTTLSRSSESASGPSASSTAVA